MRHTWEAYKRGVVQEIYFCQDRRGVATFVESATSAEAQQALTEVSPVKGGLIDSDVIPLGPFTNWEMLFTPRGSGRDEHLAATGAASDRPI